MDSKKLKGFIEITYPTEDNNSVTVQYWQHNDRFYSKDSVTNTTKRISAESYNSVYENYYNL